MGGGVFKFPCFIILLYFNHFMSWTNRKYFIGFCDDDDDDGGGGMTMVVVVMMMMIVLLYSCQMIIFDFLYSHYGFIGYFESVEDLLTDWGYEVLIYHFKRPAFKDGYSLYIVLFALYCKSKGP